MLAYFLVFVGVTWLIFLASLLWSKRRWVRLIAGLILLVSAGMVGKDFGNHSLSENSVALRIDSEFPGTDEALARLQQAAAEGVAAAERMDGARLQLERLQTEANRIEATQRMILNSFSGGSLFLNGQTSLAFGDQVELARLSSRLAQIGAITRQLESVPNADKLVDARGASVFFEGTAEVAHSDPKRMLYHDEHPIELVLAPYGSGISASTRLFGTNEGEFVTHPDIEYALRMQATLEGSAFKIVPDGAQLRRIPGNRPVTWDWTVTPKQFGRDRQLTFRLEAIFLEDSNYEVIATETYRTVVYVDVGWFDWIKAKIADVGPLSAAIGGIVTLSIAVGGFYFQHIRRKGNAPPTKIVIVDAMGENDKKA